MVRITYDTYSIQTIAMNGFFPVLSSLVLLAGMFVVMIRMDATLTLVALAIIPMLLLLIVSISGRIDAIAGGARINLAELPVLLKIHPKLRRRAEQRLDAAPEEIDQASKKPLTYTGPGR